MVKLFIVTALFGGLLFATPQASAANDASASYEFARRGCVTLGEYRRVRLGMKKSRVHRIFETRGRFDSRGSGVTVRKYRGCPGGTRVFVMYERKRGALRLSNKLGTGNPHASVAYEQARRGCVTRAEYRRVKEGMRKSRVHRIFDTRGRFLTRGFQNGVPGVTARRYRPCSNRPIVVAYKRSNRVFFKDRIPAS